MKHCFRAQPRGCATLWRARRVAGRARARSLALGRAGVGDVEPRAKRARLAVSRRGNRGAAPSSRSSSRQRRRSGLGMTAAEAALRSLRRQRARTDGAYDDDKASRRSGVLTVVLRRIGGAVEAESRSRSRAALTSRPRFRARGSGIATKNCSSRQETTGRLTDAFTVRFVKNGLFASQVVLENYRFTFKSQPFQRVDQPKASSIRIPRDPNLKKLVATLKFSHPVDTAAARVACVARGGARMPDYLGLDAATAGTSR